MDELVLRETDWKLLNHLVGLKGQSHPNLLGITGEDDLHIGVQEVLQEARVAHHLLDLAEIPRGEGYSADLDARVLLLDRVARRGQKMAELHQPDRNCDGHGGNSGFCVECGWAWPCATAQIAAGERDDEL